MSGHVVGIDLGTTNSLVCVLRDGQPTLVQVDGDPLLPSVVGLAPDGQLLVGKAARNLWAAAPERVIRSVKRRMGEDVALPLGERTMTPVEASATILRRLKLAAEAFVEAPVERAVITVPAYFTDAQRTATREAGEVAGFAVDRILNEPTAASLCYGDDGEDRTWLVYDLGGGTFDVSVVRSSRGVTEVLASHGDTHLGGDDFDAMLVAHLERAFTEATGAPVEGLRARARLLRAAEEAKIRLSTEPFVRVMEEALAETGGVPRHLDVEVSRAAYEGLIEGHLERTRRSVQAALREAGLLARDLDDVLLVGGSSRTPRVRRIFWNMLGREARMDVDPDRAVALGAGLQAARLAGDRRARVLVDVTPYTFGARTLGQVGGTFGDRHFHPIIRRNTALPTRQTDVLYTAYDGQTEIDVDVYQGDAECVDDNVHIGGFHVEGLDARAPGGSEVLFDFRLDLDGILDVTVTERATGLSKSVTIRDAFRKLSDAEREEVRARVTEGLAGLEAEVAATRDAVEGRDPTLARASAMLPRLAPADRMEVEALVAEAEAAQGDARAAALAALSDVLFYLE